MANENRVRKLKLSDGSVYYFYDADAARASDLDNYLLKTGGTITGNTTVDAILTAKNLKVTAIDDRALAITNVLTQNTDGSIQKRSADNVLEDIGGISYSVNTSTGTLAFKYGKQ